MMCKKRDIYMKVVFIFEMYYERFHPAPPPSHENSYTHANPSKLKERRIYIIYISKSRTPSYLILYDSVVKNFFNFNFVLLLHGLITISNYSYTESNLVEFKLGTLSPLALPFLLGRLQTPMRRSTHSHGINGSYATRSDQILRQFFLNLRWQAKKLFLKVLFMADLAFLL